MSLVDMSRTLLCPSTLALTTTILRGNIVDILTSIIFPILITAPWYNSLVARSFNPLLYHLSRSAEENENRCQTSELW